ncbi:hypothetical protein [Cyanobium sp. Morenito 9A2]|uniref:hypothetical protein n=1 Tax=Cyanobium sp. Morenito 9A2 TaxID=2823718 RepID=UPI0020CDD35B|nr:hypothetical protein [Cyanobium sp. Morenito 9A2]MCP9850766.1 hypothetical protein [Cyanobium sp. Morenito 9A2]
MSFNVKSWLVDAVVDSVLAKPSGSRHGITGFWLASLNRVRNERILRIGTLHGHHFLLAAEIDTDTTHVMDPNRLDEYVEHEMLKHSKDKDSFSIQAARAHVQECVEKGRIVVAFRNARALTGEFKSNGRNSVWYEEDQ